MRKPVRNDGPEERSKLIEALLSLKDAGEMERFRRAIGALFVPDE